MGFEVYWDDDARTILRWEQTGEVSVENFRQAYRETHHLVAGIDHKYHMLIDNSTNHRMPHFPISELQNAFRNTSRMHDCTIIVTTDPFARAIMGALQKMGLPVTKRIFLSTSVEEARQLIANRSAAR